ncbi:MAG: hypothetical protein GY797_17435, partial [Deltaproteobacteria bacterium]|nr:hypothetical protein [Deltaproteobacteria bacterium]
AKLGRAVGTSTVDWLQLLLFMALLGGFCFLLLSYFKNSWQLHLTLEYRGVSTQALVVECRKTDDNYHITYEFEVDELDGIDNMPVTKQTYRFRERGGNAIWCQDLKGQTVSIKYLPEDPSRASSRAFRMVIGSCCFSFLLFVSFMLLFYKLIPRNIIKKIRKPVK